MRAGGDFRGGGRRSDARLKHDVMLLGHLDNGIGFCRFSYNGTNTCTTLEEMPGSYTRSKLAAEQRALEAAASSGLPVVVANPKIPIGNDRNLTSPALMLQYITRKEHHRLIETGPYAFTRHPIYTGPGLRRRRLSPLSSIR
jgi:hypothetical protein